MNNSKIEWTDKTWNPVTGCTKVSQGCKNCYAERMYERFHGKGSFRTVTCHTDRLSIPLKWKKPAMIFVNSMSDLFHPDVPFEFVRQVLATIHDTPTHTYQVLTKRPARMVEFFKWLKNSSLMVNFPNLWLGVSVENQAAADERIPLLMQVPAAVRFLSCEPLLGPVDISTYLPAPYYPGRIDWVIVGGESGPGARPMHPDWARSLRDQCDWSKTAFFFKQWGTYGPTPGVFHHDKPHTFEDGTVVYRASKVLNGSFLDNVLHSEYPAVKPASFNNNHTTLETTHY